MRMRKLLLLGSVIYLLSSLSFVRAQNDAPKIDPSKYKFLKDSRCGEDYKQPRVAGVVSSDIDLSDDNTAKNIIELARMFAREKCPNSRDFLMYVYLWRGDPDTFTEDKFDLRRDWRATIGEAYKESNKYIGYRNLGEAVKAYGYVKGSVDKWSYENRAKKTKESQAAAAAQKKIDDERRAKEQLAAEIRAKEEAAKAAVIKKLNDERIAREKLDAAAKAAVKTEARRRRKAAFEQSAGKYELVTDNATFCTNPFPWKNKTVAMVLGYEMMADETVAVFEASITRNCKIAVMGFPNAKAPKIESSSVFGGSHLMFVAFRFVSLRAGTPVVNYVYAERCTESNCAEFK